MRALPLSLPLLADARLVVIAAVALALAGLARHLFAEAV